MLTASPVSHHFSERWSRCRRRRADLTPSTVAPSSLASQNNNNNNNQSTSIVEESNMPKMMMLKPARVVSSLRVQRSAMRENEACKDKAPLQKPRRNFLGFSKQTTPAKNTSLPDRTSTQTASTVDDDDWLSSYSSTMEEDQSPPYLKSVRFAQGHTTVYSSEPAILVKNRSNKKAAQERRNELWYSPEEIDRLDKTAREDFNRFRTTHNRYGMEMLRIFQECRASPEEGGKPGALPSKDGAPPVLPEVNTGNLSDAVVQHLVDKFWGVLNPKNEEEETMDTLAPQQRGMERYANVPMHKYHHFHVSNVLETQAKIAAIPVAPGVDPQQSRWHRQELLRKRSLQSSHAPRVLARILAVVDERQQEMVVAKQL